MVLSSKKTYGDKEKSAKNAKFPRGSRVKYPLWNNWGGDLLELARNGTRAVMVDFILSRAFAQI